MNRTDRIRWSRKLAGQGSGLSLNGSASEMHLVMQMLANCVLVSPNESRFPVDDNSIDVAVSIEVEVNEHDWFVPELGRVLRDGGIAVFTLNNRNAYRGGFPISIPGSRTMKFFIRVHTRTCAASLPNVVLRSLPSRALGGFLLEG